MSEHATLHRSFACSNVKQILICVVVGAVFFGFVMGVVAHRCCRAFSDVAAEDARMRFQALYADPNTEIEDLPTHLPGCVLAQLFFARMVFIKCIPLATDPLSSFDCSYNCKRCPSGHAVFSSLRFACMFL